MQLEDLLGKTPADAMSIAARFAGVPVEVIDGQWAQESGRGKSLRGPVTPDGIAEGHFQFLPQTLTVWEQRLGTKLNPDDFTQSLFLYAHQMRENMTRYKDVPRSVLAFHGGTNESRWGPKTRDYLVKVMGGAAPAPVEPAATPALLTADQALDARGGMRRTGAAPVLTDREKGLRDVMLTNVGKDKALAAFMIPAASLEEALPPLQQPAAAQDPYALALAQVAERTAVLGAQRDMEPTVLESIGAAISNAPAMGLLEAATNRPGLTPEPGRAAAYRANYATIERDPVTKVAYPEWAREIMRTYGRVNAAGEAYGHQLVAQRMVRESALAATSPVQGFLTGLLAEGLDPVNVLTGVGVAKGAWMAGTGSIRAIQAGGAAKAVAMTAAENAAGNVAADLLVNAIGDTPRGAADMVMSAAAGIAMTVPFSPFIAKAARQNAMLADVRGVQDEALRQDAGLVNAARARVGPDADPATVQKAAEQVHEEQLRQVVQTAEGAVAPHDKMPAGEPEVGGAVSAPVVPEASVGPIDIRALRDQFSTDRGFNAGAASDHLATLVDTALGAGNRVLLRADGKAVEIVRVTRGMMEDAEGQRWGALSLYTDPDGALGNSLTITPATRNAGAGSVAGAAKATSTYTPEKLDEYNNWLRADGIPVVQTIGDSRGGAWAAALPPGVHLTESALRAPTPALHGMVTEYGQLVSALQAQFHSDATILLKLSGTAMEGRRATFVPVGRNRYVLEVAPDTRPVDVLHEFGHGLYALRLQELPAKVQGRVEAAIARLQEEYVKGQAANGVSARQLWAAKTRGMSFVQEWSDARLGKDETLSPFKAFAEYDAGYAGKKLSRSYWADADELAADQFVKYVEADIIDGKRLSMPAKIRDALRSVLAQFLGIFRWSKQEGLLDAQQPFIEFFDALRNAPAAQPTAASGKAARPVAMAAVGPVDDTARVQAQYGLDMVPDGTERKMLIKLYRQAEGILARSPISPQRLKTLNSKLFGGIEATATRILASNNPVLRAFGVQALESPTGATVRHKTAALTKNMKERLYMGGIVRRFDGAYEQWRAEAGGNAWKDALGTTQHRQQFDRMVAIEIENRLRNIEDGAVHPAVKAAADELEAGYDRMRKDQQDANVVGAARLGQSSKGYMPHRMRRDVFTTMSNGDARAAAELLSRQFQEIEGFDAAFSNKLAKEYLDHARIAALGGNEIPMNIHDTAAADMVRDSLKAMDMGPEDIEKVLAKYSRGGANYTKKRLHLDLNEPYLGDNGEERTLLDLFETDQLALYRSYARRASGEVALAQFEIMGVQGLKLIRRAAEFGADGQRATPKDLEAFDQVAAEFLGRPFGSASKLADNLALLTSVSRLGGMAFQQLGEMANAVVHLGVSHAFSGITSLPRMVSEVGKLKRGDTISNPILRDVDKFAGAIGMDGYQMALPRIDASDTVPAYGQETLTAFDRMLRLSGDLNAKLSFWKALHAAQQRGLSEQIVHKAVNYIRKGEETNGVLKDMGFTPELVERMRVQIDTVARFEGDTLVDLRLSEMADVEAAETFASAVLRGAGQIIQGTFIGETGKLAHSSTGRLLAQFRTFSITSVEKQWNRTSNNVGTGAALGYLLGSMAWALPLYYARVAIAATGRNDREEYLERRLAPGAVARAVLNYTALSGYAADILDISAAVVGHSEAIGGRVGGTSSFFGNTVAPSAGLVEDAWKATQKHDLGALMRLMPGASLPYMVPLLNTLRPE